jgi:hypothetical protein
MVGAKTVPNGAFGAEVAVPVIAERVIRSPAAPVRELWRAPKGEHRRKEEGRSVIAGCRGGLEVLWRVSVGLQLHWRHSFAGDLHAPKKVRTDAHTPKN